MTQKQKQEHTQKLNTFFRGNVLKEKHADIIEGHPIILVTPHDEPWSLSVPEIEEILHQYYPDLSATAYMQRIVIFHEAEKE